MQNKTPQSEFDAKLSVVSEIDWARLAAYVDGAGTIMIAKTNVKKGTKSAQYVLTLIVANTDPRLMCWLCDTFTGHALFSHSAQSRMAQQYRVVKRKTCFSWRQFEERAAEIIRHIMPYLIMKRDQAEIALAYREIRKSGVRGRRVTPENLDAREALRLEMRALNSGDWERQER